MTDDAKMNMMLNPGLSADEQKKVDAIEGDVVTHFLNSGKTDRPFWTSATVSGKRVIRLCLVDGKSTLVMEITASKFAAMSQGELLAQFHSCT